MLIAGAEGVQSPTRDPLTWKSFLSVVIFSKNIKESQFVFSLIIFFLPKELKGKTKEQRFQERVVTQEERSINTSHLFRPAESIAVFPAGTGEAGRGAEYSWTPLL